MLDQRIALRDNWRKVSPSLPQARPGSPPAPSSSDSKPPRLDNPQLIRTLHQLELSTWADFTTRAPLGIRFWLDLSTLLQDLILPSFPPVPHGRETSLHKFGQILAAHTLPRWLGPGRHKPGPDPPRGTKSKSRPNDGPLLSRAHIGCAKTRLGVSLTVQRCQSKTFNPKNFKD